MNYLVIIKNIENLDGDKHKLELKNNFGANPSAGIRYRSHIVTHMKNIGYINEIDYDLFDGYGTIIIVSNNEATILAAKLLL